MARLPQPGGDNGNWGDILNDFLLQALKPNGLVKDNAVTANTLAPNSVTNAAIASDAVNATSIADGSITNALLQDATIQEAKLSSAVQTKLNNGGVIADGSVSKAKLTSSVQTSLDKADSALQTAPVTSVAGKIGVISLDKSDVGLTNVDNTSDVSKPISTAAQTALDAKSDDATVLHVSGTETVIGSKDFTGGITINGTNIVVTSDTRLNDQRTPTDSSVTNAKLALSGGSDNHVLTKDSAQLGGIKWSPMPTAPVSSVAGKTGAVILDKSDIGLSNVDNTSDSAKNSVTATLTNKTIDLSDNVITMTTAQLNTALSDADIATDAGLANKVDKVTGTSLLYGINAAGTQTTAPYSESAVAQSMARRDPNANLVADNFITGFDSTVSSAGTTTLTVDSKYQQYLTGTTTHTHTLPTTGIVQGMAFRFTNKSTLTWIINASGGATVAGLTNGQSVIITANQANPTSNTHWDASYQPAFRETISATGATLAVRDTSGNLSADNFLPGVDITTAAAGTTVLTSDSKMVQRITGTLTQTMQLPTTSVTDGTLFIIDNKSTVSITVNASDATGVATVQTNTFIYVRANQATPTNAAHWNKEVLPYNTGTAGDTIVRRTSTGSINATALIPSSNSTVTAAGTTTLTNASTQVQFFTGSTTQTVVLPTTGIIAGQSYTIMNQSTGNITVQSSAGNVISTFTGMETYTALVATPTLSTDWFYVYQTNKIPTTAQGTSNSLAQRDGVANLYANNFIPATASTATAAGTTTLTNSSAPVQIFTGTTTQTVTLPTTSIIAGYPVMVINQSTGLLTVNSSGGNLIATVPANGTLAVQSNVTTPTTAAHWTIIGRTAPLKLTEFTNSSTTTAYAPGAQNIPNGAIGVKVSIIPGGAGGGSGRRGAAGTIRGGGGGGAVMMGIRDIYLPIPLGTTTYTPVLGQAGAGGAAVTTDNTDGNVGTLVNASAFTMGSYNVSTSGTVLTAGQAGTSTAGGQGGNNVNVNIGAAFTLTGGNGGGTTPNATDGSASWAPTLSSSAGGGGGISAADVAGNGGQGAVARFFSAGQSLVAGGVVDSTAPVAGANANSSGLPGQGGGGGAASKTSAAQAGADATGYGAPGGGGGASLNGFNSGRGGNGGPSYMRLEWVYA